MHFIDLLQQYVSRDSHLICRKRPETHFFISRQKPRLPDPELYVRHLIDSPSR